MTTQAQAFSEQWLALMSILSEEDILRLRKRAEMRLPESPARYKLVCALEDELLRHELLAQIAAGDWSIAPS